VTVLETDCGQYDEAKLMDLELTYESGLETRLRLQESA
jgi:hypothetical protein